MLDRKNRQVIKWLIAAMVFIASVFTALVLLAASANAASRTEVFPRVATLPAVASRGLDSTAYFVISHHEVSNREWHSIAYMPIHAQLRCARNGTIHRLRFPGYSPIRACGSRNSTVVLLDGGRKR